MSNKFKAKYDEENDVLFIYHSEKKSHGSIEFGKDIHISFSPKSEVTGLEFLEASKTISLLSREKISKTDLLNLRKGYLDTTIEKGLIIVRYYLFFEKKEKPIIEQLVVQDINYKSPITA
ncbi:MAG: DUF2283 domain-containing protein [archaeon]|nr:DUF2283 domain-containing protein [archaeon]